MRAEDRPHSLAQDSPSLIRRQSRIFFVLSTRTLARFACAVFVGSGRTNGQREVAGQSGLKFFQCESCAYLADEVAAMVAHVEARIRG
jgi:hypothetical protein